MKMEMNKTVLAYLVVLLSVLLAVAFITLFEQKVLASAQIRLGPNASGYWGLMQPFADAVKLLMKETSGMRVSSPYLYSASPVMGLALSLGLWLAMPLSKGGFDFFFSLLFFFCISGLAVYPILIAGWSSNCNYSMMGSLRSVAQMVSYEVSLIIILLSLIWLSKGFSMPKAFASNEGLWNLILLSPLAITWFVSSLAETNRTPYDFSEGESELVSGFNTEYSAAGFTLIFMAEYASILLMSVLFSILFFSSTTWLTMTVKAALVATWMVWARGTLPRFRYDKLMNLAWKSILPVATFYFFFTAYVGSTSWA